MEIGEAIAVAISTPDPDEPCWACKEQPPEDELTNQLNESPDSIGEPENQLHNDSSELGRNLGHRPEWQITAPDTQNGQPITRICTIVPAAHHLIPGNASLKKVPSLLKLMEKSKGEIRSDIGYNVNSAQNGVWLPANYGVRPSSEFGKKWGTYAFQQDYARAAMKKAGAQFHDAHPSYSDNVKKTLRSLADKINLKKPEQCGICDEQISDKARPPYGLVGRLNSVSRQHRGFLKGPPRKWPTESNYFTSRHSKLMK